jgi:glycine oxidase
VAALGVRLGVKPVRGQMVLFRAPRPPFTRVLMSGKRYLVPRGDGRVLVGSTEEPEAGFDKANTPAGIEELRRFAFELCPELREAEIEATWAGLRPGSPDGWPYLGPVPGVANVFCAAGHFRAGVQLSLGSARLMTDLLTGIRSELPADAFRLDRPPVSAERSAFRS